MKNTHTLLVRDWKQDVINLVQFPRCKCIPQASPFALKLETWLRFNRLNYRNVSNDMTKASNKGQIPFIELNGRQFADSNLIVDHLTQACNLDIDKKLTTREKAEARAINVLIEESFFRCIAYDRSRNFGWFATDNGLLPHFSGLKKILFEKIFLRVLQNRVGILGDIQLKNACYLQGIGRLSVDEVDAVAKKDLAALSTLLGDKRYLFGDSPSSVDATLFGHLCQAYYTPLNSDKIKPFMEESTPNLVEFIKRVKAEYWSDWDVLCQNLVMNASDLKSAEAAAETTIAPSS